MYKIPKWPRNFKNLTVNVVSFRVCLTILESYTLAGNQISIFLWNFVEVILVISAGQLRTYFQFPVFDFLESFFTF